MVPLQYFVFGILVVRQMYIPTLLYLLSRFEVFSPHIQDSRCLFLGLIGLLLVRDGPEVSCLLLIRLYICNAMLPVSTLVNWQQIGV